MDHTNQWAAVHCMFKTNSKNEFYVLENKIKVNRTFSSNGI